ncbi:MAG TPA: hypothetical protein VLZ56_00140, partial [Mycoplana sp.]|nr:hypothetical protein [Mycoplana sp.]
RQNCTAAFSLALGKEKRPPNWQGRPGAIASASADIARADDPQRAERCIGDDVANARLALRHAAIPGDLNEIRFAENIQHGLGPSGRVGAFMRRIQALIYAPDLLE